MQIAGRESLALAHTVFINATFWSVISHNKSEVEKYTFKKRSDKNDLISKCVTFII